MWPASFRQLRDKAKGGASTTRGGRSLDRSRRPVDALRRKLLFSTGSVLLALAVAHGKLTSIEAWVAAHVDENFEMRTWGEDAEALRRRARQWREMEAAARLFQAVHGAGA